jgi:hypothetical protein
LERLGNFFRFDLKLVEKNQVDRGDGRSKKVLTFYFARSYEKRLQESRTIAPSCKNLWIPEKVDSMLAEWSHWPFPRW